MASSQKQNCKPDVLLVKCMCSVQILPAGFGLGMYIQKGRPFRESWRPFIDSTCREELLKCPIYCLQIIQRPMNRISHLDVTHMLHSTEEKA